MRFFQLRNEVKTFIKLTKTFNEYEVEFNKLEFLESIAFLSDITQLFNLVYVKLQGQDKDVFYIVEVLEDFVKLLKKKRHCRRFSFFLMLPRSKNRKYYGKFSVNIDLVLEMGIRFADFSNTKKN